MCFFTDFIVVILLSVFSSSMGDINLWSSSLLDCFCQSEVKHFVSCSSFFAIVYLPFLRLSRSYCFLQKYTPRAIYRRFFQRFLYTCCTSHHNTRQNCNCTCNPPWLGSCWTRAHSTMSHMSRYPRLWSCSRCNTPFPWFLASLSRGLGRSNPETSERTRGCHAKTCP